MKLGSQPVDATLDDAGTNGVEARAARTAGPTWLAEALAASRADTLATFVACERALDRLQVPHWRTLNPPLWELGHIGWFQDWWIGRHPGRSAGPRADPQATRLAPARAGADALYDSSRVAHDARWSLPLPGPDETRADLAAQLGTSLRLLGQVPAELGEREDDALYFFRLALLHEDMHHEAALYMAQALGVPIGDPRWQARPLPPPAPPLHFGASRWRLGWPGAGFAFDNELAPHDVDVAPCEIDAQVLRWADYLPFVEAGGYQDPCWWDAAGRAWLAARSAGPLPAPEGAATTLAPRYLRRGQGAGDGWQHWRHGAWQALDPALPACHLTAHEAEAWCRWAGRRLPTEGEWERAALEQPGRFRWGDVWEWTASPFRPYPGFEPHPYRDYSAPWFETRRVLRGASFMTQPRLRHPRYRNFFEPQRADVPAGFRSCAGTT